MFRRDFLGSLVGLLGLSKSELFRKNDKIYHKEWGELKSANLSTEFCYTFYSETYHQGNLPLEYALELTFEKMNGTWTTFNLPSRIYKNMVKFLKLEVEKLPQVQFPPLDNSDLFGWDLVFDNHRFKLSSLVVDVLD